MENHQIRDLSDKQLAETIAQETLNLTKMRLSHAVSSLENPKKLDQTRKLIARLKTEQRARQLKNAAQNTK